MSLTSFLELFVSVLLVASAAMAVFCKHILRSVIFMSIASMAAVVAFIVLQAPDVAVTEAVIGSGLVTTLFLLTLIDSKKEGERS